MEFVGQPAAFQYLKNGLDRDILSPSLIFLGPLGVGRRTAALELAAALITGGRTGKISFPAPLDSSVARRVRESKHPDLLRVNWEYQALVLKGKSDAQKEIRIESVRALEKFLHIRPMESARRVALIEMADKLNFQAANALLKILEEPPQGTHIILVAETLDTLPPTIPSRCGVIRFGLISEKILTDWLVKEEGLSPSEAEERAQQAQGTLTGALNPSEMNEDDDLETLSPDEFFDWLNHPSWRRDGRKQAQDVLTRLLLTAERKMTEGDLSQAARVEKIIAARRKLEAFVPPRLVLENLFLSLEPIFGQKGNG